MPPKHALINLLGSNYPKGVKSYVVLSAIWFTSVRKENLSGVLPQFYSREKGRTLFLDDMENIEETLEKVFDLQVPDADYKTQKEIEQLLPTVKTYLNATCSMIPVLSQRLNENDIKFEIMTEEQLLTLQILSEHKVAAIKGMAGSGKTLMAIEKAKNLVDSRSDRKVLFVCFNKIIKDYIKTVFSKQGYNIDVMNIHDIGRNFIEDYDYNDHKVLSSLKSFIDNEKDWPYVDIIIDEAQDYSKEFIEILHMISKKKQGYFYIFYDLYQMSHVEYYNYSDKWISDEWIRKIAYPIKLIKNCRNTMQISDTACSLVDETKRITMREVNGRRPILYNSKSEKIMEKNIISQIEYYTDQGIKLSQITLLSIKSANDEERVLNNVRARMKIGRYPISEFKSKDTILFTTARKFKGNESDIVIIVDVDKDIFSNKLSKKLLYVALSRAKHEVAIHTLFMDEERSKIKEFSSRNLLELISIPNYK